MVILMFCVSKKMILIKVPKVRQIFKLKIESLSKRRKVSQSNSLRLCEKGKHFDILSDLAQSPRLSAGSPSALGIGAASFWSAAEKDIAESPTAERSGAGTPKERRLQVNKTT